MALAGAIFLPRPMETPTPLQGALWPHLPQGGTRNLSQRLLAASSITLCHPQSQGPWGLSGDPLHAGSSNDSETPTAEVLGGPYGRFSLTSRDPLTAVVTAAAQDGGRDRGACGSKDTEGGQGCRAHSNFVLAKLIIMANTPCICLLRSPYCSFNQKLLSNYILLFLCLCVNHFPRELVFNCCLICIIMHINLYT